jgi:hypothetical protein
MAESCRALWARLVAYEQLVQALRSRKWPVWMPTTPPGTGQRVLKHPSHRPSGYARIGGFPRARLCRGKSRLEIFPGRTHGEIVGDAA